MLLLIKAITNTRHIGKSNDVLSLHTNLSRNIVTREKEIQKFFCDNVSNQNINRKQQNMKHALQLKAKKYLHVKNSCKRKTECFCFCF